MSQEVKLKRARFTLYFAIDSYDYCVVSLSPSGILVEMTGWKYKTPRSWTLEHIIGGSSSFFFLGFPLHNK